MICSVFSTVVYCAGLRFAMTSWISRTVAGPRLQRTVRISSSPSVGLGSIYEDLTTNGFVCQLFLQLRNRRAGAALVLRGRIELLHVRAVLEQILDCTLEDSHAVPVD